MESIMNQNAKDNNVTQRVQTLQMYAFPDNLHNVTYIQL